MKTYSFGAKVRVSAIFADSAGTSVDPTTIKFAYLAAAIGAATTLTYPADPSLVKDSVGHYHVDIDSNESPGHFDWRFFSTGTNQAAQTGEFYISPNPTATFIPPASAALLTLPLTVSNGGTGSTSFTTNGVLYGQGTSAVVSTAQGAANTVLTANAGAPSFSATPTLNALTASTVTVSGLTSGRVTFAGSAGLLTDDADLTFSVDTLTVTKLGTSSNVGIGIVPQASPRLLTISANTVVPTPVGTGAVDTYFHIVGANGKGSEITHDSFGAGTVYNVRRANNTASSPTAVASGDSIWHSDLWGYVTSASPQYVNAGRILFSATENWTDTATGGKFTFLTATNGTNAALKLTLNHDGTITPGSDNAQDVGAAATRWKTGYFGTSLGIGPTTTPNAVGLHVLKASADVGLFIERTTDVAATSKVYVDGNGDLTLYNLNTAKKITLVTADTTRMVIMSTGSVGIGNTAPTPSSALDVTSTTGAILIPRMTTTQRDALTAIDGMIIYNTTTAKFQGREAGAWNNFSVL